MFSMFDPNKLSKIMKQHLEDISDSLRLLHIQINEDTRCLFRWYFSKIQGVLFESVVLKKWVAALELSGLNQEAKLVVRHYFEL